MEQVTSCGLCGMTLLPGQFTTHRCGASWHPASVSVRPERSWADRTSILDPAIAEELAHAEYENWNRAEYALGFIIGKAVVEHEPRAARWLQCAAEVHALILARE